MKLQDLPQEVQDRLNAERSQLYVTMAVNKPYDLVIVSQDGTRYLRAHRHCVNWNDNKGNYMPFGGGTYWTVTYGAIQWDMAKRRNPIGEVETSYYWTFGKRYTKSANGTEIPSQVSTKKEVLALVEAIGIFNY